MPENLPVQNPSPTRRDFHRLVSAAVGGLVTGSLSACRGEGGGSGSAEAVELHACRGLNACQGQGADGQNACAGQGTCATAKAHSCAGLNECKNQGGCGETPGQNACKGQGGCGVPMRGDMWEDARKAFEQRMQAANKSLGPAPAPAP